MPIKEVFPNPTVIQVIFQITFPNLFFIEKTIGDFQKRIMDKFPESNLLFKKTFLFAHTSADIKIDEMNAQNNIETKVWQFKHQDKYTLNVLTNSIDISSNIHKTYNNEGGEKFRESNEYVINNFFEINAIPYLQRIGLRYIDHCPIPDGGDKEFMSYYKTSLPLNRFSLDNAISMDFQTVKNIGDNYFLTFAESIQYVLNKKKLVLNFDGFATNKLPNEYLSVTDKLHEIISAEFENTIKEPVKCLMRKKQ